MIKHVLKDEKRYEEKPEVSRNPALYYAMIDIMESIRNNDSINKKIDESISSLSESTELSMKLSHELNVAAQEFHEEALRTTKKRKNVGSMETETDTPEYNFMDHNYLILMANITNLLGSVYGDTLSLFKNLRAPYVMSAKSRITDNPEDFQQFQGIYNEMQFNAHTVEKYAEHLKFIFMMKMAPKNILEKLNESVEPFYKYLIHTHTKEGFKIIGNPVITNVAMHIFENIESHGSVQKDSDNISAYSIRKAQTLSKAVKNENVQEFLKDPDKLHYLIRVAINDIKTLIDEMNELLEREGIRDSYNSSFGSPLSEWILPLLNTQDALHRLDSMRFSTVVYEERPVETGSKLTENMRNETIQRIADMITDGNVDFSELVEYVISRKKEVDKFLYEENSFYVCKIGDGNPFLGQAPGALYVEAAERPRGKLDEILGSGFEEIRNFFGSVEYTAKFQDLFLATSPSKTTDKSNVLMVGPMGCGKTEVLRSVGADKNSIGVFAQGSDFLTCWKGEAEKNPKRMFQEGLKLARESGRHVHFLIDEIDSLLNNDRDLSGNNNLTLEFQILMDGVIRYPNLSVWGATNHIQRIPMPMIRRFNKVAIVGELSRDDRAELLRRFTSYLPITAKVKDRDWLQWAELLDGATGDVMRKVADQIWREKMSAFVSNNPEKAEELVRLLNAEGKFDIDTFTKEKRDSFKDALSNYVIVSASDINDSIERSLLNVGVRSEIQTAIATYESAREYLENAKSNPVCSM
jgi:hypothetical protein